MGPVQEAVICADHDRNGAGQRAANSAAERLHHLGKRVRTKENRKEQRPYDKDLYKLRHLVENAFLKLKGWRGIATRYAKNSASFLAAVQIRSLFLWASIS